MQSLPTGPRSSCQLHRVSLGVELLERRTLLATNLSDGLLTVTGTNRPDVIDVGVQVDPEGNTLLSVTLNGVTTAWDAALVDALRINGLGRDDSISISDDVMVDATVLGGRGHDVLDGGGGDDELHGHQGNDSVEGGTGADEIYGDKGNDLLDGEEGDDYVDGGLGDDECYGGHDDDVLEGGDGEDGLFGEEGNDLFDGEEELDEFEDFDAEEDQDLDLDAEWEIEEESEHDTAGAVHAQFQVEHEDDGVEVEFEVELDDALPCSVFDVLIDGFVIGQISTDDSGSGELQFSNDPDDDDELPFPIDFPAVAIDSVIAVEYVGAGACAA